MQRLAMRGYVMVLGMLPGMTAAAQQVDATRMAPDAGCLDARAVAQIRQSGLRQIDVASTDNRFHRLLTQDDCPGVDRAVAAEVLAAEGWVCDGRRALIRHDGLLCPVAAVQEIDARTFAMSERASRDDTVAAMGERVWRDGATTLDPVVVHGQRQPGFSRSPYTCFSPRYMQSWGEDPDGITVQVSRRHPGNFRRYRVRFVSCPDLDNHQGEIGFRSGLGIGVICGHPGDEVLPVITPMTPLLTADTTQLGGSQLFIAPPPVAGCPVYEVYPVE